MNFAPEVKVELGDTATHQGPCCGKRSETVHGFLHQSDGSTSADRRAIALHASAQSGTIAFTFPPPESSPWFGKELLGGMVAVWSRRWGRECFCKSLRSEGGKLLQNSRGRGPYLLQTDSGDQEA